ncbi:MAG: hypothetical protein Q8R31_05925 [Candidatus Omnitrophota bacterium]|nr:hypothetical protein [Candidatus Omnitrophota bacterium]
MTAYLPEFPQPGSYIKYWDFKDGQYRYRRLLTRRVPLKYPRRLPQVAAAATGVDVVFDELNPSSDKRHVYMAYLGVSLGCLFQLWHPFDVKNLKWDEQIEDIDSDNTANIAYEQSPLEYPTKAIWIEHDRYPMVRALNRIGRTVTPEVMWIAALYKVKEHNELSPSELTDLASNRLASLPADFGGEW